MKRGGPLQRVAMRRTAKRRNATRPVSAIPEDVRLAVITRDESRCQRCGRGVANVPSSIQHRKPRKAGGRKGAAAVASYDMANLVLLCGSATTPLMCHHEVETADRAQAYDDGWLVREGEDPAKVPCYTYRGYWEQPGQTWELA